MPKPPPEEKLGEILRIVSQFPEGAGLRQIRAELGGGIPERTLQYQLSLLVREKRLFQQGTRRWTRYFVPGREPRESATASTESGLKPGIEVTDDIKINLSDDASDIRQIMRKPTAERIPMGYQREFLDAYIPNQSAYLTEEDRRQLHDMGRNIPQEQAAGTYARQILDRLLIDLSWNSSRLEGNTYSLLDTRRLIAFGHEADGKARLESQMILNHKEAIEFIVNAAGETGINRNTVLNLHALLANNLLDDPTATGRLRTTGIGIEKSVFHPLEVPQLIEECFDQILEKASVIEDPFEQSLFLMVQLPYLQPFDNVNKRVSRLAANMPLIRANLSPLAFNELPTDYYTDAVLAVYELNRIELMRDIYLWAYKRSAQRYKAIQQSLGQPDTFRMKYREALRHVIQEIVINKLDRETAFTCIKDFSQESLNAEDRDQFRMTAEDEILSLHEGNYSRYRLTPGQFAEWQAIWGRGSRG